MNKYVLVIALLGLVAFVYFMQSERETPQYTHYPWDVTVSPEGNTSVFGLNLAETTIEMAIQQLGDHAELAMFSTDDNNSVELYYSSFTAGRLSGRLIIVADLSDTQLQQIRETAIRSGGANRFRIAHDRLADVMRAPIKALTFIPVVDLDDEIIRRQFGEPSEIISTEKNLQHYLYPSLGLDLILDAEGKEVLQYVTPKQFSELQTPLQHHQSSTTTTQ